MFRRVAILGLASVVAVELPARPEEKATLNGTVTYSERTALPADASVLVRLEEPKPDASHRTIGEATIPTEGRQVPIPFALTYDPARVDPAKRYTVRATISAGGKTLFRTAAAYPVLTRGAPGRVAIVVVPAGGHRRPHATPTALPESSPSRSPPSSGRIAPG